MIKLDANLYINQIALCLELICLANTLLLHSVSLPTRLNDELHPRKELL